MAQPIINKAAAEKNKAASAIHMQQQFGAGAAPKDMSTINKLGAAFTKEQAGQDVALAGAEAAKGVADVEREKGYSDAAQTGQNIKDQAQLTQSIEGQKNRLAEMGLDIDQNEFDNDMIIREINENQDFTNSTQLEDLARLTFESDEDFRNIEQKTLQSITKKAAADQWALSVYERALNNKAFMAEIAADRELAAEFKRLRKEAERQAKESAKAVGKMSRNIGIAKTVVGGGLMFVPGGQAAGVGLMVDGSQQAAANS